MSAVQRGPVERRRHMRMQTEIYRVRVCSIDISQIVLHVKPVVMSIYIYNLNNMKITGSRF